MPYTVFFREGKQIFTADTFIKQQPASHHEVLHIIADALGKDGRVEHVSATRTSNGEWSVLISDNRDTYIYTMYISRLEQDNKVAQSTSQNTDQKELVVIDPSGPRDSAGGYHPGYWTISHYGSLMEEQQRDLFLTAVGAIKSNTPSKDYQANTDGSVSMNIQRQHPYTMSITCTLGWR